MAGGCHFGQCSRTCTMKSSNESSTDEHSNFTISNNKIKNILLLISVFEYLQMFLQSEFIEVKNARSKGWNRSNFNRVDSKKYFINLESHLQSAHLLTNSPMLDIIIPVFRQSDWWKYCYYLVSSGIENEISSSVNCIQDFSHN